MREAAELAALVVPSSTRASHQRASVHGRVWWGSPAVHRSVIRRGQRERPCRSGDLGIAYAVALATRLAVRRGFRGRSAGADYTNGRTARPRTTHSAMICGGRKG